MATFNGLTFQERINMATDDAVQNELLFADGKMQGCAITFSGTNITIAKGIYIFKGRKVKVDNNTTIATSPTYSNGYARLKYTIDLSAAASGETFTQGATVLSYASTNSFAALTQQDINDGTSTTYEVEICRVKYTSGSITSIVSEIAACLTDYIYWRGNVTASDSRVWFVQKWRGGRIEADTVVDITTDSALTYSATTGGYLAVLANVVAFPYTMSAITFDYTLIYLRPCMILSGIYPSLTNIHDICISSASTAPFGAAGALLSMYVHIEGMVA